MDREDLKKELFQFLEKAPDPRRQIVIQTGMKGMETLNEAFHKKTQLLHEEMKQKLKIEYLKKLTHHGISDKEIDVVLNYVDQNELDLAKAVSSAAVARLYRK